MFVRFPRRRQTRYDKADNRDRVEWNAEERMRKSAMMREVERCALETAEDVEVGSLRSECQREGCKPALAIESGTPQTGSGQKMCDGLQAMKCIALSGAIFGCRTKVENNRSIARERAVSTHRGRP